MGDSQRILRPLFVMWIFLRCYVQHVIAADENDRLRVDLVGPIPAVFEGMPISLVCFGNSTVFSNVTWSKDGVQIATCDESVPGSITLPDLSNSSVSNTETKGEFQCSLEIDSVTTMDHNGTYTCNSTINSTHVSDSYVLEILEHRPFCSSRNSLRPTSPTDLHEFLSGDVAVFQCHNLPYVPPKDVHVMFVNTSDPVVITPSRIDYEAGTFYYSKIAVIDGNYNGSTFTCVAAPNASEIATNSANLSCSLGPLSVYDSPFLIIEEVERNPIEVSRLTLRCRFIPGMLDANLSWSIVEDLTEEGTLDTHKMGIYSFLSVTKGSSNFNVTCTGVYDDTTFTATYSINSTTEGTTDTPGTVGGNSGGGLPDFVIPSAAIGGFLVICVLVFVILAIVICHRRRNRRETTSDRTDEGENAGCELEPRDSVGYINAKDTGYDNAAIGVAIPMKGLDKDYDLPPFGVPNLSGKDEGLPGNYTTMNPYFDPAVGENPQLATGTTNEVEQGGIGEPEDYACIGPYHDPAATDNTNADERSYYDG